MKLSQLCIGSAALILTYANQVMAGAPPDLGDWTMVGTVGSLGNGTCEAGFSCSTAITDRRFFQRMIPETSSGISYFQTIITEQSSPAEQPNPSLTCPDGFTCGYLITAPTFIQLEFTDGANI